jgi:thiol-disulfide isomerase/thioredoxin
MNPQPPEPASSLEPQPAHRARLLGVAAALAALAVIAAALFLLRSHGNHAGAAGTGALDTRSPVLNQPVPNFALADADGHVVRLSDLRGQVVLVNFWATWCVPCRQELPAIEQVYSEQRNQGFTVLEVNEQESPDAVRGFTAQLGSLPPVVLDRDGSVMAQYRLKGLPDSFIVDRQGVVRGLSFGPVSRETILNYIDAARHSAGT